MLTGILLFALVGILAVATHRGSRLERKIVKNIPLTEWVNFFIYPFLLFIGWSAITRNILSRPLHLIFPMEDFDTLGFIVLCMIWGSGGNALHFTGKILWRYLSGYRNTKINQVNEMFHGKMSHYLIYLSVICMLFLMALLELNHPLSDPFPRFSHFFLIVAGIVFGLVASKSVFFTNEWYGGYNRPLFFISTTLLSGLISLHKFYAVSYRYFPMNAFIVSVFICFCMTFVIRQIMIFTQLNQKRKLRYIAKFLNI